MKNIYYFFRNNPDKNRFIIFGRLHFFILFIALVGIFLILKNKIENRKFELFIAYILIFQQSLLYMWYFTGKYKLLTEGLPLYHCRIAIIFLSLGLILNKNSLIKIGSYLGIFGSTVALSFIILDPFSFPHITQFSFFIGHLFLLWGSVYALFIKNVGMTKVDLKNSLIFINLYHLFMFILNKIISSNYAYINASPISFGKGLNIFIYALIVNMLFSTVFITEYNCIKLSNNIKSKKQISLAPIE